jgi:hypothetical protein
VFVAVTQTGVVELSWVQSALPAQARHVLLEAPASAPNSQIGFGPLQSLFATHPTHIPDLAPASSGTQTGVPPSGLPQEPFTFSQLAQVPASISQIGLEPPHWAQVNGFPPAPAIDPAVDPAMPPAPPIAPPAPAFPAPPPVPPFPPVDVTQLFVDISQCVPASEAQSLS